MRLLDHPSLNAVEALRQLARSRGLRAARTLFTQEWPGTAEIVALEEVAALGHQHVALFLELDSLRDDHLPEVMTQANQGADDSEFVRVLVDPADQRQIELDEFRLELRESGKPASPAPRLSSAMRKPSARNRSTRYSFDRLQRPVSELEDHSASNARQPDPGQVQRRVEQVVRM